MSHGSTTEIRGMKEGNFRGDSVVFLVYGKATLYDCLFQTGNLSTLLARARI
jgi:hypothetical protein